jgi:hypothetical protein
VLACRSIEIFERLALDFTTKTLPPRWRADCFDINDRASLVEDNGYHVQKIQGEYVCVQSTEHMDCHWTKASALVYLGQGPQLSDEQFAQATQLHLQSKNLDEIASEYSSQGRKVAKEAEIAADPATRARLLAERDRLDKLRQDHRRQGDELWEQARNIKPAVR